MYFDLYGWTNVIIALKNKYVWASTCNKSIPGPGSMTKPASCVQQDLHIFKNSNQEQPRIKRVIVHRTTEDITLVTNYGYLKFSN